MRKLLVVVAVVVGLAGCTNHPIPDYMVNTKNIIPLEAPLNKIKIVGKAATFDDDGTVVCRVGCFVKSPTKKTFTEYITDALMQELELRGLFDGEEGQPFSIQLTKVEMSTGFGSTHWEINSNCYIDGATFSIATIYKGRSSFAGISACNNIATYFEEAVRKHIEQIFANPIFRDKVHWVEASVGTLPDISSRLKQLEQLHADGLITDDEYKIKRKAIIDSF